jgi:radical SAM protein with 4Fe4S-binding SPASM domain
MLAKRVASQRVPLSGSLALTHRCNLGCVHCYVKEASARPAAADELETRRWQEILNEIKEAGCLHLLLTGGEPLLREDFPEIYSSAKRSGFLVTVFTNGTLVSDRIIDVFHRLPPRLVEITLYGAAKETHDRITGVPGSFARTMSGIETLLAHGIRLQLKSILMTLNHAEFPALEALARNLGLKFRFDAAIFPTLAGDPGPLDLRVTPQQAVDLEMASPEKIKEWQNHANECRDFSAGNQLYNCGAGVNTFHIDAHGWLFPCQMVASVKYRLVGGNFLEGWSHGFNGFRDIDVEETMPCHGCEKKIICGYCPGFFEMENASLHVPSSFICETGRLRSNKLNSFRSEAG